MFPILARNRACLFYRLKLKLVMDKYGTIELRQLKFHAYHGCLPEERITGADYVVDLTCRVDIRKASASDELAHTVDYSLLYNIVKDAMSTPVNLLEKVAATILKNIRCYVPQVKGASVTVCKYHPPFEYAENALEEEGTNACVTLSF